MRSLRASAHSFSDVSKPMLLIPNALATSPTKRVANNFGAGSLRGETYRQYGGIYVHPILINGFARGNDIGCGMTCLQGTAERHPMTVCWSVKIRFSRSVS